MSAAQRHADPLSDTSASPMGTRITAVVARHPMASFLVLAYTGVWASWMPVLFLGAPPRPFTVVGAVVGLALPALAVTAAVDGRDGVVDLLHRAVHGRVGVGWYLLALFAVPSGMLATAPLLFGSGLLETLGGDPAALVSAFVLDALLALITVQLFEELGWTGFVQHRLQARSQPLRATLLVSLAFALIHLPTYFHVPVTGRQTVMVLVQMLPFIVFAALFRTLITWIYNCTAFSVLLAALLHASFNAASSSSFSGRLGPDPEAGLLPLVVVAALALAVAAATRGRLGLRTTTASPGPT